MKVAYKRKPKRNGLPISWMILIMLATSLIIGATIQEQEKRYPVSLTQPQWIQHSKWIDIAKNALTKSDLPAKDVSMINDSLSAFQNELGKQLVPLFQAENKNEKPPSASKQDSVSKKNN